MNLIIKNFSILQPIEKKAFSTKFNEKLNLVIGEKDSGKSSLIRAIMYTFGCDLNNFDFINKLKDNIYIMEFEINNKKYILIRKKLKKGKGKNFFKVLINNKEVKEFYSTGDFKDYLNDILNIKVTVLSKEGKETKLYPNHIFLPFYTDQDNSWQNYLVNTFVGLNFINDYKKVVLEYFTGLRPNSYYELNLEREKLKNKKIITEASIKSKKLVIEENDRNIKIIENINIEDFSNQYKYVLDIYSNIIKTEHEIKKNLNEKIYKKNALVGMKTKIDSSIKDIKEHELECTCPNCKQVIYKDMEENYKLYLSSQNLLRERELLNMYIQEVEEEIKKETLKIAEIKNKNELTKQKLDASEEVISLSERANSYALNKVSEKFIKECNLLEKELEEIMEKIEINEAKLNKLNKNNTYAEYNTLMIAAFKELEIEFAYKNYYNSNLESVNIDLSGTTKNQAYIAQYLSIFNLISNNKNVTKLPIFIDTYVKDDFNGEDFSKTTNYIFKELEEKSQSFVFISNNEQTLKIAENYNHNKVNLNKQTRLSGIDYDEVYSIYKDILLGE